MKNRAPIQHTLYQNSPGEFGWTQRGVLHGCALALMWHQGQRNCSLTGGIGSTVREHILEDSIQGTRVDPGAKRQKRCQFAAGFRELAFHAQAIAIAGMVATYRDMDDCLEEGAIASLAVCPGKFECLVGLKEKPAIDLVDRACEGTLLRIA